MKREHAWRVFAAEFNDAAFELKGEEEMAPSYIITPLGGKINRLFIVGVLTDVEQVSEGGEFVRAHISDPTGVFTVFSGQFQPEITEQLTAIEVPSFVALVGKSRGYMPEDGDVLYASVRPERIYQVDASVRDRWIVETCQRTKERIEAMIEAKKMDTDIASELSKIGFNKPVSEGVELSLKRYDFIDVNRYVSMLKEAIEYIASAGEIPASEVVGIETEDATPSGPQKKESKEDDAFRQIEDTVLEIIKEIEGEDGASWDDISEKCQKAGIEKDMIEEALNSLMDKGLIYEPMLGTIKTT
jgi:uncharacterized protein